MAKVYQVNWNVPYDGSHSIGIFSSISHAVNYILGNAIVASDGRDDTYTISEVTVDDPGQSEMVWKAYRSGDGDHLISGPVNRGDRFPDASRQTDHGPFREFVENRPASY